MTISFRTIMRGSIAVFGLAAFAGQSANAATVTTIFSTGVVSNDANGNPTALIAGNAADTHYSLATSGATPTIATGAFTTPVAYDPTAFPATVYGATTGSLFIGPVGQTAAQNTFFDFRTTFSLAGFNAATANLTGNVAADNQTVAIFLNGVDTGFTANPAISFARPQGFTIASGFLAANNTLDFIVLNSAGTSGNYLAFDADALRLSADALPASVPEPGSIAMLIGISITGAGFLSRRKRTNK